MSNKCGPEGNRTPIYRMQTDCSTTKLQAQITTADFYPISYILKHPSRKEGEEKVDDGEDDLESEEYENEHEDQSPTLHKVHELVRGGRGGQTKKTSLEPSSGGIGTRLKTPSRMLI